MSPAARFILCSMLLFATLASTGCVRRTVTIDSQPPGAIVWMNDREVGRTPVDVDFLFYGTYDMRLDKEGYEPQLTSGRVRAPWWDNPPLDLFAELLPINLHSRSRLSYQLVERDDDPAALTARAREFRSRIIVNEDESKDASGE